MLDFIRRWKAARKRRKILDTCRRLGHALEKKGEMTPGMMVGGAAVPTGKAEFWFYGCECGYTEINEPGMKPYERSWEEGEKLKKAASVETGGKI